MRAMNVREYLIAIHKTSVVTGIGGQLPPDQARAFIHTTLDQAGFLSRWTRQEVIAATATIDIMSIAARSLRVATEDNAFVTTTSPTVARKTLTKTTAKLMVRITDEFLHQNIEEESIDEVLLEKFAIVFANDLNDLSINADGTTGDFLDINTGLITLMEADASVHDVDATAMGEDFLNQIFPSMLAAMPNKYKANKPALALLVSPDNEDNYAEQLISRETAVGDAALLAASAMKYRSIEVIGHPYMPDTSAILTMVNNLVFGYGLLMTRESQRQPQIGLGATDWFINAEFDFEYAISDAVVLASNV